MTGPSSADAVNAVVVGPDEIPTISAVIHRQLLLGRPDDLPSDLSVADMRSIQDVVEALRSATEALQQEILAAITAHEGHNRTKLVRPIWVRRRPTELDGGPADLAGRTLAQANLVKARWQEWLDTEKQRLRRSRSPRTGESPYIMPADLSLLSIRPLPPSLGVANLVVPIQQGVGLTVGE